MERRKEFNTESIPTRSRAWRKTVGRVVPKLGLKYTDVAKSNTMWEIYMKDYLHIGLLKRSQFDGDPSNKHWDSVSVKMTKADFHGCYLSVIRSISPGYVGIEGIVVMETLNVFQLLGKNDIVKTVQKKLCQFQFELDEYVFTFFGKDLQFKPSVRAVKKNKTPMFNMFK